MSEFELKIESQPLFTVSMSTETDQTPYSMEVDTSDITVFTVTFSCSAAIINGLPLGYAVLVDDAGAILLDAQGRAVIVRIE